MSKATPRIRRLVSQANRLAEQNRFDAADTLYQELLIEAEDDNNMLLEIADMVTDEQRKKAIYQHILSIDPQHNEAMNRLAGGMKSTNSSAHTQADEKAIISTPNKRKDQSVIIGDTTENPVGLRCNRCNKPITMKTSTHTPVGYRCHDCVREVESSYFTATLWHYLSAGIVSFLVILPCAFIITVLSFWLIAIFAGSAIGTATGRIAFWAARRHRGRYLPLFVATMILAACATIGFLTYSGVTIIIFSIATVTAAYYQLK